MEDTPDSPNKSKSMSRNMFLRVLGLGGFGLTTVGIAINNFQKAWRQVENEYRQENLELQRVANEINRITRLNNYEGVENQRSWVKARYQEFPAEKRHAFETFGLREREDIFAVLDSSDGQNLVVFDVNKQQISPGTEQENTVYVSNPNATVSLKNTDENDNNLSYNPATEQEVSQYVTSLKDRLPAQTPNRRA